jgi:hypothetical protein
MENEHLGDLDTYEKTILKQITLCCLGNGKVKVEVKVKVNFPLVQATKAHRGSRGIAVLLL